MSAMTWRISDRSTDAVTSTMTRSASEEDEGRSTATRVVWPEASLDALDALDRIAFGYEHLYQTMIASEVSCPYRQENLARRLHALVYPGCPVFVSLGEDGVVQFIAVGKAGQAFVHHVAELIGSAGSPERIHLTHQELREWHLFHGVVQHGQL